MDTINEPIEPLEGQAPADVELADVSAVDSDLQSAYNLYLDKSYSKALNILLPVYERDKTGAYANFIGNCYQKLGSVNDAVTFWQKATKQNPSCYQAFISLGNVSFSHGDKKQALIYWHIALSIKPECAQINYNLAIAYSHMDSRLEAIHFYEKFLKYCEKHKGHDYANVSNIIARFRRKAGDLLKYASAAVRDNKLNIAVQYYMKALKNYPLLPKVILNVAKIFNCDRNYDKAIEYYKFALKVDDKLKICMVDMANAYISKKEYALAYCYFKRFLSSYKKENSKFVEVERICAYAKSKISDDYDAKVHLNNAIDYEKQLKYKDALDEYENYKLLSEDESERLEENIKRLRWLVQPERELMKQIIAQIEEYSVSGREDEALALCDRVTVISVMNSAEFQWASRKKQEIRYTLFRKHGNKNA